MIGSPGLTRVRTDHLVELVRAVHRGTLRCPFQRVDLATAGFLAIADNLEHLRGLDARGVLAVVTAVLAERARGGPTGPTPS
ncbi:MAG: hypothetical protein ABMA64_19295 [Myxococcota bacterium]